MGERIRERARERQTKMRKHVLCVCLVKSAEQCFLAVELQEHPAASHGTATSASGSCEGKGEYLLPKAEAPR